MKVHWIAGIKKTQRSHPVPDFLRILWCLRPGGTGFSNQFSYAFWPGRYRFSYLSGVVSYEKIFSPCARVGRCCSLGTCLGCREGVLGGGKSFALYCTLYANAFAVSTRRAASPVTFTESDVAVGMSISRVPQHRMMSDSAGDGRELFRWPWNGRLSLIFSVLSTLRGGQKVTETVTYTRYLASGTCLTL